MALEQLPDPTLVPGSVLLRPVLVGMCGTDLEIIDGTIHPDYVRLPLVLGHEWSGVVADPGSSLDALPTGASAVVEGIVPCGRCPSCLTGDTNRCSTYDEFGFVRDGAAADLLVAPAGLVHLLAASVSGESAALIEPASVVLRALRRAAPPPGARVLVVGDGSVGLLAVKLLGLCAPASITLLGARPEQEALAAAAGADVFVTRADQAGTGYDLVVEAAGAAAAATVALRSAGRGGTVILLGLAGTGSTVDVPIDDLVNGDITVMGSFSYTRSAWAEVVDLLNSGRLDLGFLITHRYPLEDFAAALACLRAPVGARGKVILEIG